MSEKKYDLIITSVDSCAELTVLSQKLGKALRVNPQQIEFSLNEVASLGGASDFPLLRSTLKSKAKQLQAYLLKQGLGSEIREEISIEAMTENAPKYTCPACGHMQDLDNNGDDTCESCGVIGKKYTEVKKRKDILESERRRHEALQKMGLEQSREKQKEVEEKRLREEARKKLGIKKEKQPIVLIGLMILLGFSSVFTYLFQDSFFFIDDTATTEKVVENSSKPQQPMLTIPPAGGNITLNMSPPSGSIDSASGEFNQTTQSTVVTTENTPPLTDNSSQNLALQINQQGADEALITEAQVKASLVAHSIDSPTSRAAVLQVTGGEEAFIDEDMIEHIALVEKNDTFIDDPYFEQLMMVTSDQISQGHYTQALDVVKKAQDKYQKALIIHKIIESKIKESTNKNEIDKYTTMLAKLIWNESEPAKQVRIQGLLSTAYDLVGEKKVASLNLVMAIEKLRFVQSNEVKVELLCQLSKRQRSIGNISQAREILKLAEEKANSLEQSSRSKLYAEIIESYAKAMDFSSAMELTDNIHNSDLLRDTLAKITKIQKDYMSVSNPPV